MRKSSLDHARTNCQQHDAAAAVKVSLEVVGTGHTGARSSSDRRLCEPTPTSWSGTHGALGQAASAQLLLLLPLRDLSPAATSASPSSSSSPRATPTAAAPAATHRNPVPVLNLTGISAGPATAPSAHWNGNGSEPSSSGCGAAPCSATSSCGTSMSSHSSCSNSSLGPALAQQEQQQQEMQAVILEASMARGCVWSGQVQGAPMQLSSRHASLVPPLSCTGSVSGSLLPAVVSSPRPGGGFHTTYGCEPLGNPQVQPCCSSEPLPRVAGAGLASERAALTFPSPGRPRRQSMCEGAGKDACTPREGRLGHTRSHPQIAITPCEQVTPPSPSGKQPQQTERPRPVPLLQQKLEPSGGCMLPPAPQRTRAASLDTPRSTHGAATSPTGLPSVTVLATCGVGVSISCSGPMGSSASAGAASATGAVGRAPGGAGSGGPQAPQLRLPSLASGSPAGWSATAMAGAGAAATAKLCARGSKGAGAGGSGWSSCRSTDPFAAAAAVAVRSGGVV